MKYMKPQMEIISVRVEDIIITSNGGLNPDGTIPVDPTPGTGNEGSTPVQPF